MPKAETKAEKKKKAKAGAGTATSSRTHEENQERAYIAASRRSDRSLEARCESARRASDIHKARTGRGLKVTEDAVASEDMYEEVEDDLPTMARRIAAQRHVEMVQFNERLHEFLGTQLGVRQAFMRQQMQQPQPQPPTFRHHPYAQPPPQFRQSQQPPAHHAQNQHPMQPYHAQMHSAPPPGPAQSYMPHQAIGMPMPPQGMPMPHQGMAVPQQGMPTRAHAPQLPQQATAMRPHQPMQFVHSPYPPQAPQQFHRPQHMEPGQQYAVVFAHQQPVHGLPAPAPLPYRPHPDFAPQQPAQTGFAVPHAAAHNLPHQSSFVPTTSLNTRFDNLKIKEESLAAETPSLANMPTPRTTQSSAPLSEQSRQPQNPYNVYHTGSDPLSMALSPAAQQIAGPMLDPHHPHTAALMQGSENIPQPQRPYQPQQQQTQYKAADGAQVAPPSSTRPSTGRIADWVDSCPSPAGHGLPIRTVELHAAENATFPIVPTHEFKSASPVQRTSMDLGGLGNHYSSTPDLLDGSSLEGESAFGGPDFEAAFSQQYSENLFSTFTIADDYQSFN